MAKAKPKFQWSQSKRRYLYANGKPVPDEKLREWAQAAIDASKARIAEASQLTSANDVAQWAVTVKDEIRAAHRAMALLANGGQLDKAAQGRLGAVLKAQYGYLAQFSAGLESGEIKLDGKVSVRAQLYAQAARNGYENEVRARERRAGKKQERRVLTAQESCRTDKARTGCVELAKKGWQKIGSLPAIGTAACLVNCRCYFEFK